MSGQLITGDVVYGPKDDALKRVIKVIDGKAVSGMFVFKGGVKELIHFVNGKFSSAKMYTKSGVLFETRYYMPKQKPSDSLKPKSIIQYRKSGKIARKTIYKDGKKDIAFFYDNDGFKYKELKFNNDKIVSKVVYYKSGKPKTKVIYSDTETKAKTFYPDDNLMSLVIRTKGEPYDTVDITYYYESGNIKMRHIGKIKKGEKEPFKGTVTRYYDTPKQQLKERLVFNLGTVHTKEYYPNGKLKYTASMRNGHLDGLAETFYPSGNLALTAMFRMGKVENVSLHFNIKESALSNAVILADYAKLLLKKYF